MLGQAETPESQKQEKIQDALKKSEERFRQVVESAPNAMVMINQSGVIEMVNAQAERVFGYERGEMLGQPIEMLVPERFRRNHPGLRGSFFSNPGPRPMGAGRDLYGLKKDGSEFPVEIGLNPIETDTGTMVLSAIVDISARKQLEEQVLARKAIAASEERFRFMAESMPQKIFTATPSGDVDYFNEQWMEFTGLSFEQIKNWGWTQFIHPDDVEENVRLWRHSIDTGEPFQFMHQLRRTDGAYRWHLSRTHAMRDADGNIIMWIGSDTDVHEQKKTEEAYRELSDTLERKVEERTRALEAEIRERQKAEATLQQAQAALTATNEHLEAIVDARTLGQREANEEIQRFAYIVSHDLRAPLVNIMGFTSELETVRAATARRLAATAAPGRAEDDQLDADFAEALGFIKASTTKMDGLINAILKLSREGRRGFRAERLDVAAIAATIAASLRHQCVERGAVIEIGPHLPDIVADRLAVEQIFANLVENAVKYLVEGRPGRIEIAGREAGSGMVVYEIRDNGRGIDAHDNERIFELFRRAGAQDRPGEGIGLAHVRALVRRLGGSIVCESTLGKGSTFRLTLPKVARVELLTEDATA